MLEAYFRAETAELTEDCLSDIETLDDWNAKKDVYRQQLFEMLGLDPLPEKTPLEATVTGKEDHEAFTMEKVHFQSRPGLYVTGNLYVPKERDDKLPAILYVCGHGRVKIDGVSYGNKASYQHHGGWFARNGYVCLTIDTLQLGEIEGIHHGTYREKMWWWNARGYTSAGAEAWNCIRALDYLQSRPEVDPERIGVTGRSGGGAYSWWISALDERIKAAVPVAGITSLKNHVVDGCVEGHCDCMYMVNTYRWDFPLLAALVSPRPLLISNTDKDRIFPLDGVVDVYTKARRIYELQGKAEHIGLQICEGPHKDTQELRIHAFHWFNKFLKGEDPLIEMAATKLFEPQQLKVFEQLPEDEQNTKIQETFTPIADSTVPENVEQWTAQKQRWMAALREKVFRGWPTSEPATDDGLDVKAVFSAESNGVRLSAYDYISEEPNMVLRLYLAHRAGLDSGKLDLVVLNALDQEGWTDFLATMQPAFAEQLQGEELPGGDQQKFDELAKIVKDSKTGMAYVAPRGIGPTAWNPDERKQTQIRRRFMLLGQTRDGMRVWDIARAAAAVRSIAGKKDVTLEMRGQRQMAGVALYASLFTPGVTQLDLWHLSKSHHDGPIFLNVLRFLDTPQAVAMAAERSNVSLHQDDESGWEYPQQVATKLGWEKIWIQSRD
ncbi:MAG: acetylxylan esterase [Planctomycetes bacterium]|nr:acetylxylan esterase [Planctomycetota bacterium]